MHKRLLLCLWVLGVVSAADDQSQRPVYIISQNGLSSGFTNGQPFFGAPVSSNSVKVLPNAYGASKSVEPSSRNENPTSIPVLVNQNIPLQGNVNQPIPVPVSFTPDSSALGLQSQTTSTTQTVTQTDQQSTTTPVSILVKAPAAAYYAATSTPRPFEARNPPSNENQLENPFSTVAPSFRLWPKLPEPVPVPVLTSKAVNDFYQNVNTNLIPQHLRKIPVPVKAPISLFNKFQQNQVPARYPDNTQTQTQSDQIANQRPIYIIIPGGNNNAQLGPGVNQAPAPNQASYSSQAPQSGNQRFIILPSPGANPQFPSSNQAAYLNSGNPLNQAYFGNQLQSQSSQQSPQNFAIFGPFNAPSGQTQDQTGQQSPLNYPIFASSNSPGTQSQTQPADLQSALKYALFGATNANRDQANFAGQVPLNYGGFAPSNTPGSSINSAQQFPFNLAALGSLNAPGSQLQSQLGQSPLAYNILAPSNTVGGSNYPSSTPSSAQYVGYSTQSPSPQYDGFSSSAQSPQYFGYSSTPAPTAQPRYPYDIFGSANTVGGSNYPSSTPSSAQFTNYPLAQSPSSQYFDYSSPTQSPQYGGFSSTPSPTAQPNYSQSVPVSRVSFSSAGGSYSYSL